MSKSKLMLLWSVLAVSAFANGGGSEPTVQLDKTVVTSATGFATDVRDIASNPTVVTSEELEEKQYSTVEDALRDIPGVDITYVGANPVISLRGQGYDASNSFRAQNNVKIMIDGVSNDNLNTQTSGTPLSSIPMSSIERIEIIPGGGAVLYGSGTTGGVINIITKEGRGTRGSVDYKYGDVGGNQVSVNAGETIGKFDFDLTYSRDKGNGYRDNDETDRDTFLGKVRYDISDTQKLDFKYTHINEELYIPEALTRQEMDADRTQSGVAVDGAGWYKTKTNEYVLNYDNKLTKNFEFNVMGYYKEVENESIGTTSTSLISSYVKNEKEGIKTKGKYSYWNGSNLIFGLEYMKDKRTSDDGDNLERESFSAFALNNLKFADKWEAITGVRWEKAENNLLENSGMKTIDGRILRDPMYDLKKSFDEFAYELGLNYLYSDTGSAYIKYEKSFLLPPVLSMRNSTEAVIDEENNIIKEKEKWYAADMEPENTDSFEIGFKDFIGNNTYINGAVFYSKTENEIAKDVSFYKFDDWTMNNTEMGALSRKYNYNLGETERKGIELGITHYFDKLTLRANYNYIDAEVKDGKKGSYSLAGTKVPNVAENKVTLGADYQATDKLLIMTDLTYSSGVYISNGSKPGKDFGKQNEYTVVNLRAKYQLNENLNIYAGINNVFDEEYYYSVGQNSKSSDGLEYDPAAERNYYAGFSYVF